MGSLLCGVSAIIGLSLSQKPEVAIPILALPVRRRNFGVMSSLPRQVLGHDGRSCHHNSQDPHERRLAYADTLFAHVDDCALDQG